MSHDVPSTTGRRWFHALVVVGASLTGGGACGHRTGLLAQDAARESGADSEADSQTVSDAGSSDAGVEAASDAIADTVVEYPMILIP